ncbi:MAG: hypothetical protein OEM96_06540, partial [Gemmatimonadota bacterium]|nr:hypothetical protein [Gemmatimonadota bacterium]
MSRRSFGRMMCLCVPMAAGLGLAACDRRPAAAEYSSLVALRSLGLAHLEEGRPAEAAGQFAELIEQAPEEALGHANLALAELRLGAFEPAV